MTRMQTMISSLGIAGAILAVSAPAFQTKPPNSRELLNQYCVTCHNEKLKTGGLSLSNFDPDDVVRNRQVLENVVRKVKSDQMPPDGLPRPAKGTVASFVASLEASLDHAAAAHPNPGKIMAHRLNRTEYGNAIHDMLALDVDATELLPGDMAGFGFDDNADVLSITPSLFARYMSTATKVSRMVIGGPDNRPATKIYKVEFGTRQNARLGEDMPFATHGGLAIHHIFPRDGQYVFRLRLQRNATVGTIDGIEEVAHQIDLRVDQALIQRFRIGGEFRGPDPGFVIAPADDDVEGQQIHNYRMNADHSLEIRAEIHAGTRVVAASFLDSLPSPVTGRGAPVGIDTLEISGPFDAVTPKDTPSRRKIFVCRPAADREETPCARKILETLTRQAYRRPTTDAEIEPLMTIYRQGRNDGDFDAGIERALEALLSSPKFLIRVEHEPAGLSTGSVYRLSDLELATRLSFFLWKSIPDEELLRTAERGGLAESDGLMKQVQRMLADRRARRFMDDFGEQWLQVRNIHAQDPDRTLFPNFDPTLRESMARETQLFFESQVQENRPIPELLTASYSFLNEQLARHYGINDVYGSHFRRVALTDPMRFGLLGQGSILTVSSYANRTSVVLRGKWILENILGSPPPPPPANVPALKENDGKSKPVALRERMEEHRKNAVCATCHTRMDPLGFALEHFDATGHWRENDEGAEINTAITMAGKSIDNIPAFRKALLERRDEFVQTVSEKLMTYALDRGVEYEDAATIRQFSRDLGRNDYRWSMLIADIVGSPQFRMARASGADRSPATGNEKKSGGN